MNLITAMTTSISEVLETMFFLPVEFPEAAGTLNADGLGDGVDKLACRLSFSGEVTGEVFCLVPRELVMEMAQNFMGEPADALEEAHIQGTLTEMLNMVCGNALSKFSVNRSFDLGLPEMIDPCLVPDNGNRIIVDAMKAKLAVVIRQKV